MPYVDSGPPPRFRRSRDGVLSVNPLAYLGRWGCVRRRVTPTCVSDLMAMQAGPGWYSVFETFGAFQRGWAAAGMLLQSISTDPSRRSTL